MFSRSRRDGLLALALASLVAAVFWVPAAAVGRGYFPAPLDDVYIHFDFARSLGQGHPFEWIAGQGYSSGETSPLYAVLLAIGWVIGFRGRLLGVWAAVLAVLSVASLLRSVRHLVRPCGPWWLAWSVALLPLSIGISDWALFSGMEVAVFVAVLAKALEALAKTRAPRALREGKTLGSHQWRLGLWGAALVLLRPEAGVVVGVLSVIAARGAGARSGFVALVRSSAPGAFATLLVLGSNWLFTGDARSAGAQLKLLSSNPYMSDVDRARVFTENLITFWVKVVRGELAATPLLLVVVPLLALMGVVLAERRALASACVLSAIAWLLLVSWNGNAPHHNFRYYVPALVLLCVAASLGLASLASLLRKKKRAGVMTTLTVGALVVGAWKIPGQARHFRTASANIRDQHIEVAERIAATLPADARVLVGDAGAIPYVSNRSAIDALGLGGYRGVPFARAAVHGEPAMIELIERLDPAERPTHFALYPNWFAATTGRFGVEIDRVTIEHNVICGSPTKAIYRADWSALTTTKALPENVIDAVDVGDVIDEAEHAYVAPLPHGGWTTLDVLIDGSTGARLFDGGRIIPYQASESFVAKASSDGRAVVLTMRIDNEARGIVLKIPRQGMEKELTLEDVRHDGQWRLAKTTLDQGILAGDLVILEARAYAYSSFHIWITRAQAVVTNHH